MGGRFHISERMTRQIYCYYMFFVAVHYVQQSKGIERLQSQLSKVFTNIKFLRAYIFSIFKRKST